MGHVNVITKNKPTTIMKHDKTKVKRFDPLNTESALDMFNREFPISIVPDFPL